jgi:organic radical activating enzyme
MFGRNSIVGQKYFDQAQDKLFVTSVFGVTLQGEGPYRGQPALFVRLAKCNLACSFCDTFFDDGDWFTYDELNDKIDNTIHNYFQGDIPHWAQVEHESVPAQKGNGVTTKVVKKRDMVLVITGGEPMLQKNLVGFLERMNTQFKHTQIESNGTVWQAIPDETTLVVSPKCSEKRGVAIKYLEPKKQVMDRADCLKFVMNADPDSPYSDIPAWAHAYAATNKPVFISPMNIYNDEPLKSKQLRMSKNHISLDERSTVDEVVSFWESGLLNMPENQKNHEYAAKYCTKHGFILNLQIHLYASLA